MTLAPFTKFLRLFFIVTLLAGLTLTATPAHAASITLTANWDAFPGDGLCSLREAIIAANTDTAVDACPAGSGADTIIVPTGQYDLTLAGVNDDAALTGDLDITEDLTLIGNGSDVTTINGNYGDRVFHIVGTPVVEISGVTISLGNAGLGSGGGILNEFGTLTLTDSSVEGNTAGFSGGGISNTSTDAILTISNSVVEGNNADLNGGGIFNFGILTVTNSSVDDNIAGYYGGGLANTGTATITNSTVSGNTGGAIYNASTAYIPSSATVTITNSTLSSNTASDGGAIYNANLTTLGTATVTITNSTLSGNSANDDGGGVYNDSGTTNLHNVTIANNTADSDADGLGNGGGVFVSTTSTLNIGNSIIAGNIDNSAVTRHRDCSGKLASLGYNLIEKVVGCAMVGLRGNLFRVSPLLGPLQNNGGATQTHALLAGSPAIDAGNPAGCADGNGIMLATDQRGFVRPLDGNGDGTAVCDMGAYE